MDDMPSEGPSETAMARALVLKRRIKPKPTFLMVVNGHTGLGDDGVWFEGNVDHFDDTFLTGTIEEAIRRFAKNNDSFILGEIKNVTLNEND